MDVELIDVLRSALLALRATEWDVDACPYCRGARPESVPTNWEGRIDHTPSCRVGSAIRKLEARLLAE